MNTNNAIVTTLVVVAVIISVLAFTKPGQVVVREIVGAQSGPTFQCAKATWNPPAILNITNATTSLTVQGARLGDLVLVSFDSATTTDQWSVVGNVQSNNTIWVQMNASATSSVNLTTSTVKACYSQSVSL